MSTTSSVVILVRCLMSMNASLKCVNCMLRCMFQEYEMSADELKKLNDYIRNNGTTTDYSSQMHRMIPVMAVGGALVLIALVVGLIVCLVKPKRVWTVAPCDISSIIVATLLTSARQHPSYGDCLEVKREYYQNSCVVDCVTQCSQSTAHLCEQFLQVQQIVFVTLRPLHCVEAVA